MKKGIFSFLLLCLSISVFAQTNTSPEAQKATDELVKVYQLDDTQSVKMLEIQQRKYRNLSEIATLQTTDKRLYRHKIRAIQQSTDATIRRLLKPEQLETHKKLVAEKRQLRADKVTELKEKGATRDEIEAALIEMGF